MSDQESMSSPCCRSQECFVLKFSDEEENELALWLVLMKQKVGHLLHAPVRSKPDTHSRSLSVYSGKCYLLAFSMGVGAGFGGVFFCPTLKDCDLTGENAPETLVVLQFGLCAAAALWVHTGTEQFFRPLMSICQWHFMQKALYYLTAATRQLYSGLNSQNHNIPTKLFRKSYIPSSGDR